MKVSSRNIWQKGSYFTDYTRGGSVLFGYISISLFIIFHSISLRIGGF